jgi:hypothetical protein
MFSYALAKVVEQGRPSVDPNGYCMYRNDDENGLCRCALGWLIPDEEMRDAFEEKQAGNVVTALDPQVPKERINFLVKLQLCHDAPAVSALDNYKFVYDFQKNMVKLANSFNLEYK